MAPRTIILACAACLVATATQGCGGGGNDSSTTADKAKTTTGDNAKTKTSSKPAPKPKKPKLTVGARIAEAGKKPFGPSVKAKPGDTLQLLVSSPPGQAKSVTVDVTAKGGAINAQATVGQKKASAKATSSKSLSLLGATYNCQLPPATFCPAKAKATGTTGLHFTAKANETPIVLSLPLGGQGDKRPAVALPPQGLPDPGAPVSADVTVRPLGGKGKAPDPAKTGTLSPEDSVQVLVRPAPESAQGGVLHIGIPKTAGSSIKINAGGTASNPSSTATLHGSGGKRLRITGASWTCQLPPGTFCPMRSKRTSTGIDFKVKSPRMPVVLVLRTSAG